MQTVPFTIKGYVYPPQSSQRIDAQLDVSPSYDDMSLRAHDAQGQELAQAPLSKVHIHGALGRNPRKISFADGTVFETADHAGFAPLDRNTRSARLHRLERFGPHLIVFIMACLAFAYLVWRYGLDILASVAVAATPNVVLEQIDTGALQTLDYIIAEPSKLDAEQQTYARQIYDQIIATLPEKERTTREFKLLFRAMPNMGPNALALPGGTMVITDELVETFPDQNVIAGVIGHEIGHVVEEHGLRRLYRSLGAYVLIALLAGETGPMLEDVLLEGNALLSLSYGRAQESSADRFGLHLSHDAGFDPQGLKTFFTELSKEMGDGEEMQWFSTHPSNAKRIKAIDAQIKTLASPGQKP